LQSRDMRDKNKMTMLKYMCIAYQNLAFAPENVSHVFILQCTVAKIDVKVVDSMTGGQE